jgi:sugar/nucleoside kinase (ribokinase family)
MQTFLGASTTLGEDDIEEKFFEEMDFLLIEGYLWSSESAKKAIKKAVEIARKKNVKIIFSLSDFNLVKMFREEFAHFIQSYVHILIGNENEFEELFDKGDENKFIQENITEIMVKTKGDKGVEVFQLNETKIIPSFAIKSVVDTTGAGDMFAAGFLHQMLNGREPLECASFGCKMASAIIQQYGARLSKEIINDLVKKN